MKVRIRKANYVHEWMMKEYGSWEDHNHDVNHPCYILQQTGKTLDLTPQQIKDLIVSGEYQSTSWNDDEIEGGKITKKAIAGFVQKLSALIKSNNIQ